MCNRATGRDRAFAGAEMVALLGLAIAGCAHETPATSVPALVPVTSSGNRDDSAEDRRARVASTSSGAMTSPRAPAPRAQSDDGAQRLRHAVRRLELVRERLEQLQRELRRLRSAIEGGH